MKKSGLERGPYQGWNDGTGEREAQKTQGIAPGKVTRTSKRGPVRAVQAKAARMPAPVQQRQGADSAVEEYAARSARWLDTAVRPDLGPDAGAAMGAAKGTDSGSQVQMHGGAGAARGDVHALAAQGLSGAGSALPHLDRIQRSFGRHDVSGVQAYIGGPAAEAGEGMGAEAYATGDRTAFRSQPDLHTAAHEAAHVVQQRAGVQLDGGVGRAGDAYEQHADQVADAVVAGRSAEGLLARATGAATHASAGGHAVQRAGQQPVLRAGQRAVLSAVQFFGSREHKHMGDEGARGEQGQTRMVELAPSYRVSFGDLTAMAGDYFESVAEIRRLAANDGQGAGTREEIEYVRNVHVLGIDGIEERYSPAARQAVMDRYYRLAGANSAHFTEPNGRPERSRANNAGNYRGNHESAIAAAVSAAAAGEPMDAALLCEGFASHFLTDAYAAGHVRTERIGITDWWTPKVPMFWTNLELLIAEEMARHINDNSDLAGVMSVQFLWEKVRESIAARNLPTMTFGDLVSGAVHDYDNDKGVVTQHGRVVGDGQLRDAKGEEVFDPEAEMRIEGAGETEDLAIAAVRTSLAEVERAFALGRGQPLAAVQAALQVDGQYAAERLWPRARPDSEQPVPRPPWKQPDVDALLAEPTMQKALTLFAREKAASLESALRFEDQTGVSADLQAEAFRTRITGPLANAPLVMLRRIVNYTPGTGGGAVGLASDDNARAYVAMAQDAGAMATLTQTQRIRLIRDMIEGKCGDEDEQAVIALLRTCSAGMMAAIVAELGNGSAARGIEYLDWGVDGVEWRTLRDVLRGSSVLAGHL